MQDIQHVLSDNEMSEKIPEGKDRYGYMDYTEMKEIAVQKIHLESLRSIRRYFSPWNIIMHEVF